MRNDTRATRSGTRWLFGTAAFLMLLYALNIALGMLAVKLGHVVWRLGDVGEFLLVLSGMAVFVAGLIADEEEQAAGPGEDGDSITTEGGVT
jgi:hypothetical protein